MTPPGFARFLSALLLACCLLASTTRARAQTPRFTSNDYAIDLITGPLLGGGRIVGMAGAYTAIASGIDGAVFNPAGYAERYEKEVDWFAWDVTGGLWLSLVFKRNDFDNNGKTTRGGGQTYQAMLGLRLQFGHFGSGVTWTGRFYKLRDDQGRSFDVTLQTVRTGSGYSFLNGGLVAGFTVAGYSLEISGQGDKDVSFSGLGGEVGVLLRPARKRYRAGLVGRTPVNATLTTPDNVDRSEGARRALGLVLPYAVHVPWELSVGFAYQFGERRTNTPWRNTHQLRKALTQQIIEGTYEPPDTYGEAPYDPLPSDPRKAVDVAMATYREAERRLRRHQPRRYVLLSSDFIVYGATSDGHGLEAFLNQTPERSGRKVSYGARVGVESEVWPDRVKLRCGTYVEPSRFRRGLYRVHGTAGFDVRLFDIWRWSVRGTGTVDLAPRYFNWGVAFGLWW